MCFCTGLRGLAAKSDQQEWEDSIGKFVNRQVRCLSQALQEFCVLKDVLPLQPVGFVTFHTRAGAEAAKQDLQVGIITSCYLLYYDIRILKHNTVNEIAALGMNT